MTNYKLELVLDWLKNQGTLSDLDKDIISTASVYFEQPFNKLDADAKVRKNNIKYKEIAKKIYATPGLVPKQYDDLTEVDYIWNLRIQLDGLCELKMKEKNIQDKQS